MKMIKTCWAKIGWLGLTLAWLGSPSVQCAEPVEVVPPETNPLDQQLEDTAEPVPTRSLAPTAADEEGIRLNFKNAPLSQVLNYLSEAAGFVIVHESELSGSISITSYQPITDEEAVDLLNAVLVEKGYVAIRNGRILKIVSRSAALTQDMPVRAGADPETIPRKDELVTQIIPVRYAEAAKLIENISPLLDEEAALTANESSNAIILTDTQTNIRRIAQIIQALDTSIASISTIRVFPLQYADATQVAEVIREVFASPSTGTSRGGGFREMMEQRFRMGGRGGGDRGGSVDSEARQAASRVVAVADENTNSLVVSAPDEVMPTIEEIVLQLDSNITDVTEVKVFRLEFADAMELADVINELYYDANNSTQNTRGGRMFGPGGMMFNRGGGGRGTQQQSQRTLLQARVVAVGDPRTNSLIISASRETITSIAEMIGRLDASSDKRQQVFVVPLEHADVDNVAEVLRGMFEDTSTAGRGATGNRNTQTSRLNQRVTSGAESANTTFNNSRGGGGGGAGGR
jgi:general secretion pathway protein D